jgi:hypothetical protein
VGIDRDDTDLARATMRRVSLRLLPFLFLIYIFNFLDRTNVAIAALQMNRDLGFSATAYGFGAGSSPSATRSSRCRVTSCSRAWGRGTGSPAS